MAKVCGRGLGIVCSLIVEVPVRGRPENVAPLSQARLPSSLWGRSPETFFEAAVLLFPVARSRFYGLTGVQTIEGQPFQFIQCRLVLVDEPLDVGIDGKAGCIRALAKPGLDHRVDIECDGHYPDLRS